ncbi:hypothetical protein O181_039909 [Austropuccinia psidii MF-1]|uniref:Integrase catalytic domain-containing protein n=1 Tax=Austropuccinia psidii MF-1 TaxID=1389203 RepID=A0A9Q3DB80_9BASI|nr:hypothetical protein [Austropuccinia psidii MF-1]
MATRVRSSRERTAALPALWAIATKSATNRNYCQPVIVILNPGHQIWQVVRNVQKKIDFEDTDLNCNLEIRTYIEKSIAIDLLNSIEEEDDACAVYHILRRQFEKHLWSHIMNLLDDLVMAPEASENLHEAFANTKATVSNLRSAVGSVWTDEALTAIFFHLRNKKHFHKISNAMNSRMTTDPKFQIRANEVLQVAQRFQKRIAPGNISATNPISIMAASVSRKSPTPPFSRNPMPLRQKPPVARIPLNQKSESWARYHLSPKFPCLHCYEWGHWAQDCQQKKKGLPAIEDPQKKNPRFFHIHEGLGDEIFVLLDSGATHHVAGDIHLFEDYRKVDMTLSVASAKRHPVIGKGTINLACQSGKIRLTKVLHCPAIPGIVISLGKFMKNDGDVMFEEGIFKLKQLDCIYKSRLQGNRWYLPLADVISCNEISKFDQNLSCLMHWRLAHLSLCMVRRMQRLNCVKGLPPKSIKCDVNLCRPFSLAKSRHLPLTLPSRLIVNVPGDVVVADLMGPFPLSFDKKSYALIIQDHYSSLATIYPLKQKSEAPHVVIEWINKFDNLTNFKVKRLQTDNGGEFTSKFLDDALKAKGIVHETTIPYEHHQAGKVERTNRTIAEAARSMLIDSGLHVEMWPYAFRHALQADNPIYHPCEQDSKGWIFWNEKQRSIVRSASAVFDERSHLANAAPTPELSNIQVTNLLDPSMIQEVEYQDQSFEVMTLTATLDGDSPRSYHEALNSREAAKWKTAMEKELKAMKNMGVWEEVNADQCHHVLGTRWVFATKKNQDGEIIRHKARIVVQGHRQIKGLEFEETFATLQCLFVIASAFHWEVETFDVTTAYLHSDVDKSIYIRPPPGHPLGFGKVLALRKALYGLKQSGRCWWQHLQKILSNIGFQGNQEDQITYVYNNGREKALLWIHVDDGVLAASSVELMTYLKTKLQAQLSLKWDVGIHSIVGIIVQKIGNAFYLSQPRLVDKICKSHPCNITAEQPLPEMELESGPAIVLDREYLSRIGMLLYLAQATRPDIMFSVNYLARFSMNTLRKHWEALHHLINYVRGTKGKTLKIDSNKKEEDLRVYVDANWGGEASRSQHGFIVLLWGSPVAWNSKRQTCVASSTCQAEYIALSFAARASMWLSHTIKIALPGMIPTLISDNKAAMKIAENSGSRKNSRHIQREFHLINELLTKNHVTIAWIDSENQRADIFTKKLGRLKVKKFNDNIFNG